MTSARNIGLWLLLCLCGCPASLVRELSRAPVTRSRRATHRQGNGQHDFDFLIGKWRTHISRLERPLAHSEKWIRMDGTVQVRKVWQEGADLGEVEARGSSGRFEGLTLRLYDPQTQQWRLYFANSKNGVLAQPMIGEFKHGVGEFYDQETFDGRAIYVRNLYSNITANSFRFEQAFSDDGAKRWETNWVATFTREGRAEREREGTWTGAQPGQHDFDFNFGTWKTHVSRLVHPLSGSNVWAEYDGISVVGRVWKGRASLLELEAKGKAGRIEGVGLRLYNRQAHEWSLNWASGADGIMEQAMIGEFQHGTGEFYDQEIYEGRAIFVRNGFSDITSNSSRFEQAFSEDGGRTWETNWVMTFRRMKQAAGAS